MKKVLQPLVQTAFLVFFIFFSIKGKIQLWMGIFLAGILASFLFGRIFCGWVCTINTLLKGVAWIKRKFHIKSLKLPEAFRRPWVRILVFSVFMGFFMLTMVTGKRLPVMHIFLLSGVILTFLFAEELWHRYLCPYGTILSLTGSRPSHGMKISPDSCTNCGVCMAVCPAKAVKKKEKHHEIISRDCLVCMECSSKCRYNAICYK